MDSLFFAEFRIVYFLQNYGRSIFLQNSGRSTTFFTKFRTVYYIPVRLTIPVEQQFHLCLLATGIFGTEIVFLAQKFGGW